jgi:hypothetical protein
LVGLPHLAALGVAGLSGHLVEVVSDPVHVPPFETLVDLGEGGADEHNVRKAVFRLLGILQEGEQSGDERETKVKDGSMTFTEVMELIRHATRRLTGLRLGHKPEPSPQEMTLNGFI